MRWGSKVEIHLHVFKARVKTITRNRAEAKAQGIAVEV